MTRTRFGLGILVVYDMAERQAKLYYHLYPNRLHVNLQMNIYLVLGYRLLLGVVSQQLFLVQHLGMMYPVYSSLVERS